MSQAFRPRFFINKHAMWASVPLVPRSPASPAILQVVEWNRKVATLTGFTKQEVPRPHAPTASLAGSGFTMQGKGKQGGIYMVEA